eukprot:Gb_40055 [translate_table: standard]
MSEAPENGTRHQAWIAGARLSATSPLLCWPYSCAHWRGFADWCMRRGMHLAEDSYRKTFKFYRFRHQIFFGRDLVLRNLSGAVSKFMIRTGARVLRWWAGGIVCVAMLLYLIEDHDCPSDLIPSGGDAPDQSFRRCVRGSYLVLSNSFHSCWSFMFCASIAQKTRLAAAFLEFGMARECMQALHSIFFGWNKRVLISVLLLCFPTFIAQFCFEVISPSIEFQKRYSKEKEGYGGKIPKYFTTVFKEEDSMAFCTYPLFSVIVHGVFVSLFVTYFLFVAMKMISFAINKGLERRILGLIFAIVGLLPSRVLFLGCSIMSKPGEPAFEVLVFLGFLALLLCTAVCVGILVLWPIADSLAVHWIFESKEVRMRKQQSNIIPTEQYSRPLSVFVGDSDDDFSVGASQSLLGTASSSVEKDSDSLPRGGSISFRTMLRDVSLEPAENVNLFPDISRMHVFPPDSPPLPGKPMTPFLERGLP